MSSVLVENLSSRLLFFTGKGGVGKTSVVRATAKALARQGKRVLVAAWNPFDTLPMQSRPTQEPGVSELTLDTMACFREYALLTLKFEKIYDVVFDNVVLKTFVQTAPGIADSVIAGKIWDLARKKDHDAILVDLPSTGHTLSFFESPVGVRTIFRMGFVHRHAENILDYFQSNECRLNIVATPEELPIVEAQELKAKLSRIVSVHWGVVFLNQVTPAFPLTGEIPSQFKAARDRYESRLAQEKQAKALLSPLEMPAIEIPRYPNKSASELSELISANWEFS